MIDLIPGRGGNKTPGTLVKLIIIGLFLSLMACSTITGATVTATPSVATATLTATAILQPAEDVTAGKMQPIAGPGIACFGSFGHGLTCIEDGEWVSYTREDSPLGGDQIQDIAVCANGRILVLHTFGVSAYDGQTWREYAGGWGNTSGDAIACDADGGFWVAHFEGVTHFDGAQWTTYAATEHLSTGPDASNLVYDVAVAPGGQVWVITASSVAVFENNVWTVYEEDTGFDQRYFFGKIALDRNGHPWVTCSQGVFSFDGLFWTLHENGDLLTTESIAIDANNRVWIGTLNRGVAVLENGGWRTFSRQNSDLASDHVRTIAADADGRVWLGTVWGVHVIAGDTWTTFQMHTASLVDNDIYAIGVIGKGPTLPPVEESVPGSLRGRVVATDGAPLPNATIAVCVESLYKAVYEQSPCVGQPYARTTATGSDGTFTVDALPAGFYVIAIDAGGQWVRVAATSGLAARRVRVQPGEDVYLGEIILGSE